MFPEIDGGRRGRSKRRFIIPLLVSVVAFAWWVGNISQDNLDAGSYLQQVRTVSDNQAARAESFQTLYLNVGSQAVAREALVVTMDQLRVSIDGDIATLLLVDEELPAEAQGVRVLINLALDNWRTGLIDFQGAALRVPAGTDPTAELDLRAAVANLQVGDAIYKSLVEEVQQLRAATNLPGSPFPEVVYMDVALGSGSSLDRVLDALRANAGMLSDQSVSVTFSNTTPAMLGDTTAAGRSLLPNAETIDIEVTLSNQGTDTETGLTLTVSLRAGGAVPVSQSAANFALDGSGAYQFLGFAVEAGPIYVLTAVLTSDAGVTIEENSLEFEVSPPSS
jgi:hypothetical protein